MSRFLQFDNVALSYPGMIEPLLGGVTAHFPEGAWTGIVGANGAGKTTLLKISRRVRLRRPRDTSARSAARGSPSAAGS
jgi:ABC-type cobalamin/Fe3+-siderophores transport system ATPase subunit